MIVQKLVDFINAAAWMTVGTRDARLRAVGCFALGARLDPATGVLTTFVPDAMGERVLPALRETKTATFIVGEPVGHETYQLKGEVTEVRPMSAAEGAVQQIFLAKMGSTIAGLGLPVQNWKLPPPAPATTVVIRIRDIYVQTPGPGAGAPDRAVTMGMLTAAIKPAMQGVVPAMLFTCGLDGVPNATVISQVYWVDEDHVALSFQFFSKTIKNVRENPYAFVEVIDPATGAMWRLDLQYVRSEESGKTFEEMEMQLEAIASAMNLTGVFHLRAADIYHVLAVGKLTG